jgi:UDP-glucose:(glucosyl)LPS alpha-1,2-glucosyltransferase
MDLLLKKRNDKQYEGLYEQARQLPNVTYIGYKPNEYIKENLHKYHIFAYPNIWEETFCISALEAMAAGCYLITTNFGALFETCAEFASYVPYQKNYLNLARGFAVAIEHAAKGLESPGVKKHLEYQIEYANQYYNWTKQGNAWTKIFTRSNRCKTQVNLYGLINNQKYIYCKYLTFYLCSNSGA